MNNNCSMGKILITCNFYDNDKASIDFGLSNVSENDIANALREIFLTAKSHHLVCDSILREAIIDIINEMC